MTDGIRLVVLESPYAGDTLTNLIYARAALADCLFRGEAPFAQHLLYTQPGVLDDRIPVQRGMGLEAGLSWGRHADATVVYTDLGISAGMRLGIIQAEAEGRPVEYRDLPGSSKAICPCGWVTREEGHWNQAAAIRALDHHVATAKEHRPA
jgi:hypothetical protein